MSQDILVLVEHLRGEVADISYVMLAAARSIARASGGRTVAVLLGHGAENLSVDLSADGVLYADDPALADFNPGAYVQALANLVRDDKPRAFLMGETSIGTDIAGRLAIRLGLPLVSRCLTFGGPGGIGFTSQICGGKIMAEGELPGPTALATVLPGGYKADEGRAAGPPPVTRVSAGAIDDTRVALRGYEQPAEADVDIARQSVLVSVGRGIQQEANLELADELARLLGGAVSASRPVVDQGWLPTSRMVGKSGKRVKPKLYFALGISGAPEHVEGIADAEVVVAVNTDPSAPIFAVAQHGTTADLFDLVPVLTDRLRQAKGN